MREVSERRTFSTAVYTVPETQVGGCRSQAQIVQSLIKIKPAAKVKLKGRQAGPESKRLKREEDGDWNAPDVKGEPEEVKPDKTDVGLAGLLGNWAV